MRLIGISYPVAYRVEDTDRRSIVSLGASVYDPTDLLASFHIAARLRCFETVTDDFTRLIGRAATPLEVQLA